MAKLAAVTLVSSPAWEKLADTTLPSQRAYAKRLGAEFIVLGPGPFGHRHYDKWQLHELLNRYDRAVYLDADVIVRPDCPDLFEAVPMHCVGGENELVSFPDQARHLARFVANMGFSPLPCPYYLNGGVLVISRVHRELFRDPEAVLSELPWPEQNHLNARLIREQIPVHFLPLSFNDRSRKKDYLRTSFILHYSVLSMAERIKAAKQDLEAWDGMFHLENQD
jgi:hypothetical protein